MAPRLSSRLQVCCTLALLFKSCSAQDMCASNGGVLYDSACYVFADPSVSCADRCTTEGVSCNEDALHMSDLKCEAVLEALGVDIASTTSSWYYNFGPQFDDTASSMWSSSIFDENRAPVGSFRTSGCIVSPTFDATDQTSFTTAETMELEESADAAEAHNFQQETPTCDGASAIYRRVCSCFFIAAPTTPPPTTLSPATPSPTTPAPTTPAPMTPSPTTPSPTTQSPTTQSPTTPVPTTPAPISTATITPRPTPGQTPSIIEAGFWRTGETSADVRPCPIPGLCVGGFGGGDDLCVGSNKGPYCQLCPSSHFSSVNGVCVECGSFRGVTALETLGLILATLLLFGAATFVGPVRRQAPGTGNEDDTLRKRSLSSVHVHATQQATIDKLIDLKLLVSSLQHDLVDKSPQRFSRTVKDLLVTTEMFSSKLIRLLPRVPKSDPSVIMKQVFLKADLLCPVIDQLASALAGLSGAAPGEEATVVAQMKSALATARALDPSTSLRHSHTTDVRSAAKVVVSFAQLVTTTPFVLVVRRPNNFRSFLGGLNMVNISGPKVLSIQCLVHSNFYGELILKTIGPLAVTAVIGSLHVVFCSSLITISHPWRNRSMRCTEYLIALAYFMMVPATNAALRTFSCETFDDGRTLLRADYSIDCDVGEHNSYRALAIIMGMLYPFGSLATFSAVLWKHRDLLYPHQIHGRSQEDTAIAQEAKHFNAADVQRFGLLHDAYEPRAWWFETFETCRRIVLASLVYFATRPSMQLWIAMAITLLSLAMNAVFSPFLESTDGHLYTSAQFVGLALWALALVAETGGKYEGEGTSQCYGLTMVVLVAGYILTAVMVLLVQMSSRTKDGVKLNLLPRGAPAGSSATEKEELGRTSLAYLEEGDEPGEEQDTTLHVLEASATDEQESMSFSPLVDGGAENNSGHTTSESSTRDDHIEDPASHLQTHTGGARPMGWSRRANKNTARAKPLGGIASRTGTVAPTHEDLYDDHEEGSM